MYIDILFPQAIKNVYLSLRFSFQLFLLIVLKIRGRITPPLRTTTRCRWFCSSFLVYPNAVFSSLLIPIGKLFYIIPIHDFYLLGFGEKIFEVHACSHKK